MKKLIVGLAFMIFLYVGQSSLLPLIAFRGVSADLLLLMVVSVAFLHGAKVGTLVGFIAGLYKIWRRELFSASIFLLKWSLVTGAAISPGVFSKSK